MNEIKQMTCDTCKCSVTSTVYHGKCTGSVYCSKICRSDSDFDRQAPEKQPADISSHESNWMRDLIFLLTVSLFLVFAMLDPNEYYQMIDHLITWGYAIIQCFEFDQILTTYFWVRTTAMLVCVFFILK